MTEFLKKYKFIILTILIVLILLNYKYLFQQNEKDLHDELINNQEEAKDFENAINAELENVLKELEKQNSSDIVNKAHDLTEEKMDKIKEMANEFAEKRDEKLANDVLNNSSLSNGNSSKNPCKNNCW